MTSKPGLLLLTGPFSYGSLSAARALAPHLRRSFTLTVMAQGAALRRLQGDPLFAEVEEEKGNGRDILHGLLRRRTVAGLCDIGQDRDELWADCLASGCGVVNCDEFLWRKSARDLARYASFGPGVLSLFEDFPGADLSPVRGALPTARLVPPLVSPGLAGAGNRGPSVVIGLGGCSSPLVPAGENGYPRLVLRVVLPVLRRWLPHHRILVCCGIEAAQLLASDARWADVEVAAMPQPAYFEALRRAEFALVQPSMRSPYESFLSSTPTILLPPQNFTQCFYFDAWRRWGLAPDGANLTDVFGDLTPTWTSPEEEQEKEVQAKLRRLHDSPGLLRSLRALYEAEVRDVIAAPAARLARQGQACVRLGHDRGAPLAAAAVARHLGHPRTSRVAPGAPMLRGPGIGASASGPGPGPSRRR